MLPKSLHSKLYCTQWSKRIKYCCFLHFSPNLYKIRYIMCPNSTLELLLFSLQGVNWVEYFTYAIDICFYLLCILPDVHQIWLKDSFTSLMWVNRYLLIFSTFLSPFSIKLSTWFLHTSNWTGMILIKISLQKAILHLRA
jgi:hypothetical protein